MTLHSMRVRTAAAGCLLLLLRAGPSNLAADGDHAAPGQPHRGIMNQPLDALERLSRECSQKAERDLFTIRRFPATDGPPKAG
ncbi:MAG: hypothetical protein JXQ71_14665 [Verrucomicrobia bacterium]|nr:hypothetical protein [Verrucomicrobiota bacterium]